jgi:beta-mannosidase
MPATVPGTAAAALRDAGRWRPGEASDLDAEDWWFQTEFEATPGPEGEEVTLLLGGVATVAEVFLNCHRVLESDSMFHSHAIDVGALLRDGGNRLAIRCRALGPLLAERRKPRARWRTRLVDGNLRFFRTMLLGRAPGFAPGPAAVGPWRPVRLRRRSAGLATDSLDLHTRLDGEDGALAVRASLRPLSGAGPDAVVAVLSGPSGEHRVELEVAASEEGVEASGTLRVPGVARWWPHTHGEPALHDVRLEFELGPESVSLDAGRVGFRSLAPGPGADHDLERDGLDLHVNGVRVFARGAVWTPVDPVGLSPAPEALREALEAARDAGMNMVRIPGTSAYESPVFHDLCDELGILVWQDFMFANLDYPLAVEGFRRSVEREAREVVGALAGRPSLAVLCGNSEVEQQVAMLGLDPAMGRGELFGTLLPAIAAEASLDAVYVPSAPCGGDLPFRFDRGVANYFGVGGYRRPLDDARRAGVRFASECLAISNIGAQDIGPEVGVPRDAGAEWDFGDVRDHYLELLFEVDPGELRSSDPERYLELSRAVSGELMAAVLGEWRRPGSPCGGGLILWLRDLEPGAGWGVVDHTGRPKPAYHHLRRALAPAAVWMTDEGLGGVGVHVANDGPAPLAAQLRIALYANFEQRVEEVREAVELGPHEAHSTEVEAVLGRFVDASWAYRFGPPAQTLIVASLERDGGDVVETISQSVHLPAGRPDAETAEELGLQAAVQRPPDGERALTVSCRRFLSGLRIHAPGFVPDDDCISVEPGASRTIVLRSDGREEKSPQISLSALNMRGRVTISAE